MSATPLVAVVMGSSSDLPVMQGAVEMLERFDVPHEVRVVSAHRTPRDMLAFGQEAAGRGLRVLIAGAGGAAHLPGMLASVTRLPVIGVPVALSQLDGLDSLLSIVQMPKGVPVATMAVNGARNAGLLAVRILGLGDADLAGRMEAFQEEIASDARAQDADVSGGAGHGKRWLRGIWRSGSATRPTPSSSSSTPTTSARATRPTSGSSSASPPAPSRAPPLMVPCPWAREASSRYRGEDVGVHLTLNAEYELYRWGPITHAPSLLGGDGGFPEHRRGRVGPRRPRRSPAGVPGPDRAGDLVGLRRQPPRLAHGDAAAATRVLRRLPRPRHRVRPAPAHGEPRHGPLHRLPGP